MLPEFVTQSKRQEVVQNRIKILQILHCNYNEELRARLHETRSELKPV